MVQHVNLVDLPDDPPSLRAQVAATLAGICAKTLNVSPKRRRSPSARRTFAAFARLFLRARLGSSF